MKISVVVPCYNSKDTISRVVSDIIETLKQNGIQDYEIILVNDFSSDNVFNEIIRLASQNSKIKGVSFSKNFGQHAALMAGYRQSTGDVVVSMDDDGQTPASEMFLLINRLNENTDVAIASYDHKQHNKFRNWGSRVNRSMARLLLEMPKNLKPSSYFAMKRFIVDEITKYENAYPYILGLILRTTANIVNVPVHHQERKAGQSGYTYKKLFSLWLNGFTAFSVKPLRVATIFGMLSAAGGFIAIILIIIKKLLHPNTPAGWSSTMAVILFVGGMIMLMLGIIGEYIGRQYISMNKAPQYVIRETINIESHDQ